MKKLYQLLFLFCVAFSMTFVLGTQVHAEENTDPVAMELDQTYTITPTETGENCQYFSFTAPRHTEYIISTQGNTYDLSLYGMSSYSSDWNNWINCQKNDISNYSLWVSKGMTYQFKIVTNREADSVVTPYTIKIQTVVQAYLPDATPVTENQKVTAPTAGTSETVYTFTPEQTKTYLFESNNEDFYNYYKVYKASNSASVSGTTINYNSAYQLKAGTTYLIIAHSNINSGIENSYASFQIKDAASSLKAEATPIENVENTSVNFSEQGNTKLFLFSPEKSYNAGLYFEHSEGLVIYINSYDITDNNFERKYSGNFSSGKIDKTHTSSGTFSFEKGHSYVIEIDANNNNYNYENPASTPSSYQFSIIEEIQLILKQSTAIKLNETVNIQVEEGVCPEYAFFTFTPDHSGIYSFESNDDKIISYTEAYDITDNAVEWSSDSGEDFYEAGRTYVIVAHINYYNKPTGTYSIKLVEQSYSTITMNQTYNVEISEAGKPLCVYFTFTPERSAIYKFSSTEEKLISRIVYFNISDHQSIYSSASEEQFMEEGKTYIIATYLRSYKKPAGTYPITLSSKTEQYKEKAVSMDLNTEYRINIKSKESDQMFLFTPAEDGDYKLFSYSYSNDPKVTIYCYDENNKNITSTLTNNNGGSKKNFKIVPHFEAGKTYLIVPGSNRSSDSYRLMLVKYSEEYEKNFANADSNASEALGNEYYNEFSNQVAEKTGSTSLAESLKDSWTNFWKGFWHGAFGNSSASASGNASGNASGDAAVTEEDETGHGLLTSWKDFWNDLWTSLVTQPAKDAAANESGNASGNASRTSLSIVTKLKQAIIAHTTGSDLGETFTSSLNDLKDKFWTSFWNHSALDTGDNPSTEEKPSFTWDGTTCTVTYKDTTISDVNITSTVLQAATCTVDGKEQYTATVVIDGKEYSDQKEVGIPALGHKEEKIPAVPATCTETGLTEGTRCSVCGETIVAQETTPALGHKEETIPAVPATCTETGLTKGTRCSVCGETLVAQKTILATGHKWDEGTKDGDTTIYTCLTCGAKKEIKEVVEEIKDQTTKVVDGLQDKLQNEEDELTEEDKSTVIQTVDQILNKIETASDIKETIEMDTIASMDELYIASEDKVSSSTVQSDYASDSSDIKVEGAALTAKQYADQETEEGVSYNTEINIKESTESIPDVEETDYVLDISLNVVKTTADNTTETVDEGVQPAAPIRMTIPVPTKYIGKEFKLYHYPQNGDKETIEYTLSPDGKTLTFVVTSLSPYAFAETPVFSWKNETCTTDKGEPDVTVKEKVDPTCGKDGKIVYEATITYREDLYVSTNEIKLPATGQHSWDQGVQKGNVIVHTCTVCKQTKTTAAPVVATPSAGKATSIKITGLSHYVAAGKKLKLTATVLPENAANKSVVWTSSNTKVATVNQSGVVTVRKKTGGKSAIITATAADGSGIKATFKVTSKKGAVTKVAISGKKTVSANKSIKLKAAVKATAGAYKSVKWTSSNPAYATVSSKGIVKATKAGKGKTVKITAMAMDGSGKKATIKIKIK